MRRLHLIWLVPAAIAVLAAAILLSPLALIHVPRVRDWSLDHSGAGRVLAGTQRIRVEQVRRLDPWGLDLEGVRLEALRPGGWEAWLSIGRLTAGWQLRDLMAGRLYFSALALDSLRLDLDGMPSPLFAGGTGSQPASGAKPSVTGGPRLPAIRCASLTIGNAVVHGPGERRWEGDVELSRLACAQSEIRARLAGAAVRLWPDSLQGRLSDGRMSGDLGPGFHDFRIDSLGVVSPGLEGTVTASWSSSSTGGESVDLVDGKIELTRLAPDSLRGANRLGLPLTDRDQVAGTIVVHGKLGGGRPAQGKVEADLRGRLLGLPLDTLLVHGAASAASASLDDLRLKLGRLGLAGSGHWERAGSKAGARLRFSGFDLSTPPISLFASGLPRTRLSGTVDVEADSVGPHVSLAADLRLDPGRLLDRNLAGFSARARLDRDRLMLDSLETTEPGTPAVRGSGAYGWKDKTLEARAVVHDLPLADWVTPWIGVPLAGRVTGPVSVSGPIDHLRLNGNVDVADGEVGPVRVGSLHAGPMSGTLSPFDLQGPVSARRLNIYGVRLDSLRADLSAGRTIETRATVCRDSVRMDVRGRVIPAGHGNIAVWVDSLRLCPGSAPEIALAAPSCLNIRSGGGIRLDSLRVESEAGSLEASGWMRPTGDATGAESFHLRAAGHGIDLGALIGRLSRHPQDVSGTEQFHLQGDGTLDAPSFLWDAGVSNARTSGWLWDRVSLRGGAGPDGSIWIDSLRAATSEYSGRMRGVSSKKPLVLSPPAVVRVDSLVVRTGRSWRQAIAALSDSLGSLLRGSRIQGRFALDAVPAAPFLGPILLPRLQGPRTILAEDIDPMMRRIQEVAPGETPAQIHRPAGVTGRVSLETGIAGTGAKPRIAMRLRADSLRAGPIEADSLDLQAFYADSLLTLKNLDWLMGSVRSHSTGTIPIAVTLNRRPIHLLPRPVHITADLPGLDLALATLATTEISDPGGRLSGRVEITGIAPNLRPNGDLQIQDGSFRIPGREERFTKLTAQVHLDSLGIHVKDAEARLNDTGRVFASGDYLDTHHFLFKGRAQDALVFETGDYRFLADAEELEARPYESRDTLRPRLTGKVTVRDGLITQDLAKPAGAGKPPVTPWQVDLGVITTGTIRLNQPLADLELGDADLKLSFRWPYWNFDGTVSVLGGSYRIANHEFRVTQGTVTFTDKGIGPYPTFDVTAETEIPWATADGQQTITVDCHVTGTPPDQLQVALSSPTSAEYTQAQLTSMLSWGQVTNAPLTQLNTSNPVGQYVGSELVGQIERQLVSELPLADRVQLEGEIGGQQPLRIDVRPIVMSQWSLDYAQDLTTNTQPDRQVSLRYWLSNLFFLNAGLERKAGDAGVPLDTYSLDLKVRFEY